jgi:hypothetical protein
MHIASLQKTRAHEVFTNKSTGIDTLNFKMRSARRGTNCCRFGWQGIRIVLHEWRHLVHIAVVYFTMLHFMVVSEDEEADRLRARPTTCKGTIVALTPVALIGFGVGGDLVDLI